MLRPAGKDCWGLCKCREDGGIKCCHRLCKCREDGGLLGREEKIR